MSRAWRTTQATSGISCATSWTGPGSGQRGEQQNAMTRPSSTKTGSNWDRIQDPRLDQALMAAGNTVDDAQRQSAYLSVSQLIHADEAVIPLFPLVQVDARKNYVAGWG